jgi:hypothetical protein
LFQLFHHLGPILKQKYESQNIKPKISNLANFTNNGTLLLDLQQWIYHHCKQSLLLNHITNPPPEYELALPSLLSPLTALLDVIKIPAFQMIYSQLPFKGNYAFLCYSHIFKTQNGLIALSYLILLVIISLLAASPKPPSTTIFAMLCLPFVELSDPSLALPFHHRTLSLSQQIFSPTLHCIGCFCSE